MNRLNAKELRTGERDEKLLAEIKKNPIYIICDNVLDTYNIGSIFRLCDALAVKRLYLCGQTETPPNPRIKKASINTWKWVEWQYKESAKEAITDIKKREPRIQIIAIEQHKKSVPFTEFRPEFPVALIVGNETYGISSEALALSDKIIELPMFGVNKSLNVMVCLGIVLYKMIDYLPQNK